MRVCVPILVCVCIIILGLQKSSDKYAEKQASGKGTEKVTFEMAWDVEELSRIGDIGRNLIVEYSSLTGKLSDLVYDREADNFAREQAMQFSRRAVKCRRTPATHALVIMISPEERNKKTLCPSHTMSGILISQR